MNIFGTKRCRPNNGKQVIGLENLSVKFRLEVGKTYTLKEFAVKLFKDQLRYEEFWALKNITLFINRGDVLGILGRNGAGKSTLLKVIAGILKPTMGNVEVNGQIAPLIELGAGFDGELTGRENIFLNGAMLGLSRKEMRLKYQEIVDFSELGDFVNTTVKNYSSGMFMRLAFSIAVCTRPEIMLVDEVLAVGDAQFQRKCTEKINEACEGGATILFVSHSHEEIRKLCNKALWIEKGETEMFGEVDDVVNAYLDSLGISIE